MTSVRVEPIFSKKGVFDTKRWKRAITNAGHQTAKAIQVDFNVTARTWDKKPDFKIVFVSDMPEWVWTISTDDVIYGYINDGTKAHIIRAKNGATLAFNSEGFRPKSRVGWIGSNKGKKATKGFVRPISVVHPGTEARHFDKAIKKKWDVEWPRQLARAIRAANTYPG